ncbi:FG-GAP-like repeat-containing protein [Rufibacter psychrotolerans]|uniref:FG-GAP-like repeat-containing protein n=1 Tax=Rufibacter psychrotolerans TaxID=2812556 RepID=UPI001966D81F|nr:FG-GAP-like repeat-containing protein [Rufibacter sp. SYSU D00308]
MKKIVSLLLSLCAWLSAAAQPAVHSFSPAHGPAGTTVSVNGTGFGTNPGSNTVYFGAIKATVTSASPTQLRVLAPAGATYQPITVTVANLTASSRQPFLLTYPLASPTITPTTFAPLGNYDVGSWPERVSVADLDGDGKAEVITTNSLANTVSILKNSSSRENIAFTAALELAAGVDPKEIATVDLDGDGKLDLVVTNFNRGLASTISVFRNTSAGNAISFAPQAEYATGNGTIGLSIADLNSDGKPDIVVGSGNSGFFSVFRNTTALPGTITLATKQDFTLLTHPNNLTTADLDQDGKEDLITSNFSSHNISLFRNTSSKGGPISFAGRIDLSTGTHPIHVITGDLDGDQKADIAVTNYTTKTISLFQNQSVPGLLSFAPKQAINTDATNICFADLNGDRKLDMVTGSNTTGLISVFPNTHSAAAPFSFADKVEFLTGPYETSVASSDLNADGSPELVVANTIKNSITVLGSPCLLPANFPTVSLSTDTLYVFDNKPETVQVTSSGSGFEWNDGSQEPSRSFTTAGKYWVSAANACGEASATLEVISISLSVPNIFTPNHDALNDAFYIKDLEKVKGSKKLTVYNRYGQEVYHTPDYRNDWKAEKLSSGVYYYSLHLSALGRRIKGWVEIIR